MLAYPDRHALEDVYRACTSQSLADRKSVAILTHYETPSSIGYALRELDIDIKKHEEDNSISIIDGDGVLAGLHKGGIAEYLKGLEQLAIEEGKRGINFLVDMGSFYHLEKHDELALFEQQCNFGVLGQNCSVLCCYHLRDLEAIKQRIGSEIHSFHSTSFIIND